MRIEPNAHGIRPREDLRITYPRYTLHERNEVDLRVVFYKVAAIAVFRVDNGENHEHRILPLLRDHTDTCDFCRENAGGFGHAVLHVHGSHVGIRAHFEGDLDRSYTSIRCR